MISMESPVIRPRCPMWTSHKTTPSLPPICLTKHSVSAFFYCPAFFDNILDLHKVYKYRISQIHKLLTWRKQLAGHFDYYPQFVSGLHHENWMQIISLSTPEYPRILHRTFRRLNIWLPYKIFIKTVIAIFQLYTLFKPSSNEYTTKTLERQKPMVSIHYTVFFKSPILLNEESTPRREHLWS